MGVLDSITNIAGLALGGYVFLKVFPLLEPALKGLGGGAAQFNPFGGYQKATPEDFGGASIDPLVQDRLLAENQAQIDQLLNRVQPDPERDPMDFLQTGNLITDLIRNGQAQPTTYTPAPVQPAPLPPVRELQQMHFTPVQAAQPQSGSFWVNPITGANIGTYVAGETPQAVLDLRANDIFPSIRGY